ncbi:uncharacterized protein LOC113275489 [Papaver somniferum]|uniref:uncharacterized protein LOC113275489 n=1 Tax=Papaver somniferum TaxID=3469 RepID=UPI000E700F53|nr:uncharacterized protein LOC113275489 [Papaver somniferum]XP_026380779.1 uncharacterized protein LOC113275489 [Papaver somniferum]XP_026380780.1 uncharacterized protein LOC113275489 [Papaver somniferum]XP_026380781.1 uncharacterized protein LOC113275489 [Papaver somniferum]XP_026380782.1 uncharacterized protein LOC113275489 [Papaver somniferum]
MVYVLLNGDENPDILLYCHPGEKEWRKHEFVGVSPSTLPSMLYFNGKLFVMCSTDNVHLEIEIHHDSEKETLCVSDFIRVHDNFQRESVAGWLEYRNVEQSWMESFGEFFRIEKYYIPRGVYQNCSTQIIISKLDFSSMAWEEIKSLDGYVFFPSDFQKLSCLASELGFSKGCVYYAQDKEMGLYRYTLEDNSILLTVPCPDIKSPWIAAEWLMITTTQRVDDRRTADLILDKDADTDKVIKAAEYRVNVAKDNEKEDIEEVSSCTMLYDDIIRFISDYLHPVDYIHLRAVSKNYRSLINLRRSFSTRALNSTDISPWLVFPDCDRAVYNFVNPMHNHESYLMNIPELFEGSRFRFSKGGWLLMSKGKTLFFYNPFTRSTIELPELSNDHCFKFSGISFSSLPTSSDCVVFGISQLVGNDVLMFFIKRGDDHWTKDSFGCSYLLLNRKLTEFEVDFNNPVFYRGAFYCLDNNGTLGVSTIEHGISWEILAIVTRPKCEFIYKTFLAECEGKLLSVLLGHLGKWVRIFRLNDTDMVWVEVKHLGRHTLFISNTSCISAIAPTGQMENRIYFPRLHNEGILYFSLDTSMFHCLGSRHSAKDLSGFEGEIKLQLDRT